MIAGLPDHVHGGARIRYPMVRVDWLRKRHQSDTTQRGDNRFVRVSWDEALDFFYRGAGTHSEDLWSERAADCQRLAIDRDVPQCFRDAGTCHCAAWQQREYRGDYSTGAAQVILPRVVGSMEVYEQQTSPPLVLENSKTIVLWGSDLIKTSRRTGGVRIMMSTNTTSN